MYPIIVIQFSYTFHTLYVPIIMGQRLKLIKHVSHNSYPICIYISYTTCTNYYGTGIVLEIINLIKYLSQCCFFLSANSLQLID